MYDIRQKVIDLLKTPQLSNLATITLDGKPWTRYVMIKSDNESAFDSQAGLLDLSNTGNQITMFVLNFRTFCQALLIGGFNPDKDRIKPGPNH